MTTSRFLKWGNFVHSSLNVNNVNNRRKCHKPVNYKNAKFIRKTIFTFSYMIKIIIGMQLNK